MLLIENRELIELGSEEDEVDEEVFDADNMEPHPKYDLFRLDDFPRIVVRSNTTECNMITVDKVQVLN